MKTINLHYSTTNKKTKNGTNNDLRRTEGEALAEACEGRGVQAVLAIVTSSGEVEVVRRPGLKALARLASDNRQTLLEIGR